MKTIDTCWLTVIVPSPSRTPQGPPDLLGTSKYSNVSLVGGFPACSGSVPGMKYSGFPDPQGEQWPQRSHVPITPVLAFSGPALPQNWTLELQKIPSKTAVRTGRPIRMRRRVTVNTKVTRWAGWGAGDSPGAQGGDTRQIDSAVPPDESLLPRGPVPCLWSRMQATM